MSKLESKNSRSLKDRGASSSSMVASKPVAKESKRRSESSSDSLKKVESGSASASGKLVDLTTKNEKGLEGSVKKDMPPMQGVGLAPKLMLAITLVTAIVTLVVGYTIASAMRDYLKDEIVKSGVMGVQSLNTYARTAILNVVRNSDHFDNGGEFTSAFKSITKGSHMEDMIGSSFAGLESPIIQTQITLEEFGKESFILCFPEEKSVKIDWKETLVSDEKLGITVKYAETESQGLKNTVYNFGMAIKMEELWPNVNFSSYRPNLVHVRLILSASKVKESSEAVFILTAIVLVISTVVSLLIAFFLARSIIHPILRLVKDMSIVASGNLDHHTESTSTDEIGYLSTTFNKLTRSLKSAHEAEIEKEKLEHDLSVGREIQQTLLPKTLFKIPGYDLDAFYMSAKEVGGDYYDLIPVDKTNLGVVVADVSGKGIQGAMIMTIMRTVMNIAAVGNLSSKNCLARTNRFLSDRIKRGMFVTAYYVILDCKKNTMRFSSAGHNPMVIYRASTKTIELFNPTGIALGFDKGPLFERTIKESEATMEHGDRFVLYTDGVVESMNEAHEEFSDQRFYDFVLAHAEEDSKTFVHKLVAELKRHQGRASQHDDITIVTFKRS